MPAPRATRGTLRLAAAVLPFAALLVAAPLASVSRQSKPAATSAPADPSIAAWKMLTQGAASDKASQRSAAITSLGTIGATPDILSLVVKGLDDKDTSVRVAAAATLGDMKARASIPALRKALDDSSADVQFTVARALWAMNDRSGREIFLEVLGGTVKPAPGVVSGKVAGVKTMLHSPMSLTMFGVEQAAGNFLGPASMGISIIEEFAKDKQAPARALTAALLGDDRSGTTPGVLQRTLSDKSPLVRLAAARSLGHFTGPGLIASLEPLLKDDKDVVRFMAAASIVRIHRASVKPK